jgi:hypothetical protein
MSLPPTELDEIRRAVHDEMANIQDMTRQCGSYRFICETGGITFLSHRPVGRILREIPR